MALTQEQLDEAVAITTRHIRNDIGDQLLKSNYLWHLLSGKNKEFVSGGTVIQQPIFDEENASQGFIDGRFSLVDTNINRFFTHATFDWKYWYDSANISLDDFTKTHNTPESIKSLLEARKSGAVNSMVRGLSAAIHGSGVDSNNLAFNGFDDVFGAPGVDYGGLNDTDVPAWLTLIDDSTQLVNYPNISRMISELYSRGAQYGNDFGSYAPDIAISNFAVQDKFMSTLQAQQRFINQDTLKAGFHGVQINKVFWYVDEFSSGSKDGETADNFLYILSSPTFKFCYKYGLDKKSPFDANIQIPNQPIKSNQAYLAGNLVCSARRYNGVFKTLIS